MSVIRVDNFGPSAGGTTYSARGIAKAWVNFNGTGTIAARDSENVSSLTDNGQSDYTVNISSAMANANYCTLGSVESILTSGIAFSSTFALKDSGAYTTTSVQVSNVVAGDVSGYSGQAPNDSPKNMVCIFGDLA